MGTASSNGLTTEDTENTENTEKKDEWRNDSRIHTKATNCILGE